MLRSNWAQNAQIEPILVPTRHAYAMLGIGHSKFYDLVKAGELSLVKNGKQSFVEYAKLKAFVARLRERTQERAASSVVV